MAEHGKCGTYNRGCRCRPCTDAQAAYQRGWRNRSRDLSAREHGNRATYNAGCRCAECREARRLAEVDYTRRTHGQDEAAPVGR
jgi:hypothetical protein